MARLFGRGNPDPQTEFLLDVTQDQLTTAAPGELEGMQAILAGQWQGRFAELLTEHPDVEGEVRALVEEIRAGLPVSAAGQSAGAARDMNVTVEGGSTAAGVIHADVTPRVPGPAGQDKEAADSGGGVAKTERQQVEPGMQAAVGDRLHIHGHTAGDPDKTGEIIEVHGEQGAPPYMVRFDDGHTSLVAPSPDAVVEHPEPAGGVAETERQQVAPGRLSEREAHLDAMLRHLGAAYYDSPHGRARASDVTRSHDSVADSIGADAVSRAVREAVKPGLLAFNPPAEMTQGRKERIEVGIANSPELRHALATGLRGHAVVQFEEVPTSAVMGVELRGAAFVIVSFSPVEQIVAPTARWEFDVRPLRPGVQTLTLCVSLRIEQPARAIVATGHIAVPVLERQIRIRVSVGYETRTFLARNWQWIVATAVAAAAAVGAWVAIFH